MKRNGIRSVLIAAALAVFAGGPAAGSDLPAEEILEPLVGIGTWGMRAGSGENAQGSDTPASETAGDRVDPSVAQIPTIGMEAFIRQAAEEETQEVPQTETASARTEPEEDQSGAPPAVAVSGREIPQVTVKEGDELHIEYDDGETWTLKNKAGGPLTVRGAVDEEGLATLSVTDEKERVHLLEHVDLSLLQGLTADQELAFIVQDSFLFIRYTDENWNTKLVYETAGNEAGLLEHVIRYALSDVYIRKEPDPDSEILGTVSVGDAVEVIGALPRWCRIARGTVNGYVSRVYLTDDEQTALQAKKRETLL